MVAWQQAFAVVPAHARKGNIIFSAEQVFKGEFVRK